MFINFFKISGTPVFKDANVIYPARVRFQLHHGRVLLLSYQVAPLALTLTRKKIFFCNYGRIGKCM